MNIEQLNDRMMEHSSQISGLTEKVDSAHKRITENDRITEGIHKLAANIETLALQVKYLSEKVESSVARLESSLKSQGERIGALEKEPGQKWKTLVAQVIGITVAALIGGAIAKFT